MTAQSVPTELAMTVRVKYDFPTSLPFLCWRSRRQLRKAGKEIRVLGDEAKRPTTAYFPQSAWSNPSQKERGFPLSTVGGLIIAPDPMSLLQGGLEVAKWIYFLKDARKVIWYGFSFITRDWKGWTNPIEPCPLNASNILKEMNHSVI